MYTYVGVFYAQNVKLTIATKSCFDPNTHVPYIVSDCYCCHHITDSLCFFVWIGFMWSFLLYFSPSSKASLSLTLSPSVGRISHSYEPEIYSFHVHIFVGICWILSLRCVFPIHFVNFHSVRMFFWFCWSLDTSAFFPGHFLSMRYFLKMTHLFNVHVFYQPNDDFIFVSFSVQFSSYNLLPSHSLSCHLYYKYVRMCDVNKKKHLFFVDTIVHSKKLCLLFGLHFFPIILALLRERYLNFFCVP